MQQNKSNNASISNLHCIENMANASINTPCSKNVRSLFKAHCLQRILLICKPTHCFCLVYKSSICQFGLFSSSYRCNIMYTVKRKRTLGCQTEKSIIQTCYADKASQSGSENKASYNHHLKLGKS